MPNLFNHIKIWLQAVRPFSFTASMIPVLLGAAAAFYLEIPARWGLLPLIIIASLAIHGATNLVSDYFDYKKGVDRPETFGSSRVLVEGLLTPRQVLVGGLILFALTAAIGSIFVAIYGMPILLLGLVGILGGFFYCGWPIGFKYLGLGDLGVFILMGPLMVLGSFFVLTGQWSWMAFWLSLPIGALVAAILSANNLRDIAHDRAAGIATTATLLGNWAKSEYISLLVAAYLLVAAFVWQSQLPPAALITFLTITMAIKNIRAAAKSQPDTPAAIATLDVQTAQLHLLFGLLLFGSMLLSRLARGMAFDP